MKTVNISSLEREFAIDTELERLRQRHSELRELVKMLSDGPGGEVYEDAISELIKLERDGRTLRIKREKLRANYKWIVSNMSKAMAPPQLGERILLLILKKDERINIPGDLAEEYGEIVIKHGVGYAKVWYYKQVVASAWPMIRKAVRWGLLASVGEWIRRII